MKNRAFSLLEVVIVIVVIILFYLFAFNKGANPLKEFANKKIQLEQNENNVENKLNEIERLKNIRIQHEKKLLDGAELWKNQHYLI